MTSLEYMQRLKRKAAGLGAMLQAATEKGLQNGVKLARKETLKREVVASSLFLNAWMVDPRPPGAALINAAPYAGYVEHGRRPGKMPPVVAIMRWVELKFGIGGREGQRMAWAISKKIAEKGVKGKFILRSIRAELRRLILVQVLKDSIKYFSARTP